VGFWVFFAGLLVALSRAERWVSFPLLGLLMFMALKRYFFLTPLRPQDRWAILAAYLSIPFALWPAYQGRHDEFLIAVAGVTFLLLPILLALASRQDGFLDSTGRVLLGVLVFVLCAGHLGVMVEQPRGQLELFGILALAAELPQRLAGRARANGDSARPPWGVAVGAVVAGFLGAAIAPLASTDPLRGGAAGVIVAIAVAAGARVAGALSEDLTLSASAPIVGRRAFLDRTMPALYAAPFFYLYLKMYP
jgi:phosphatidate cytidylyltransferase